LENRVLDSQREMADWDNLEEIQAMNRKHLQLTSHADVFAALDAKRDATKLDTAIMVEDFNEHGLTEEEEALVKSIKFGQKTKESTRTFVRLSEADEEREEDRRKMEMELIRQRQVNLDEKGTAKNTKNASLVPIIQVKRKKRVMKKQIQDDEGNNKKKKKQIVAQVPTKTKETVQQPNIEPSPAATVPNSGLAGLMAGYSSSSESN
jgi:Saf4/Yju2 protein